MNLIKTIIAIIIVLIVGAIIGILMPDFWIGKKQLINFKRSKKEKLQEKLLKLDSVIAELRKKQKLPDVTAEQEASIALEIAKLEAEAVALQNRIAEMNKKK